jgi:hypothetical protein
MSRGGTDGTPVATGDGRAPEAARLPLWPLGLMVAMLPLFWVLGLRDFSWMLTALPMAGILGLRRRIEVPPMFGLWLLFLLWVCLSVVRIDTAGRLVGFGYRLMLYLAATVVLVYTYNAVRSGVTLGRIAMVMTWLWLIVVAGGVLGLLFPTVVLTTPMSVLLPDRLVSNDIIADMIRPGLAQLGGGTEGITPRSAAPFAYTNNWGNAYSLLLPFVAAYLGSAARWTVRHRVLVVVLMLSLIPALFTLNRGMFLALGLGAVYTAFRLTARGHTRALGFLAAGAVAVVAALVLFPVTDLLQERLSASSTNETRMSVYQEAYDRTLDSPLLGFGAPRASENPGVPAVGTQGQFWMVMFSHGFVGAALFLGWMLWACLLSFAYRGTAQLWMHVVIVMATLEIFYYGNLGAGLVITMVAMGLVDPTRPQRASRTPAPSVPVRLA